MGLAQCAEKNEAKKFNKIGSFDLKASYKQRGEIGVGFLFLRTTKEVFDGRKSEVTWRCPGNNVFQCFLKEPMGFVRICWGLRGTITELHNFLAFLNGLSSTIDCTMEIERNHSSSRTSRMNGKLKWEGKLLVTSAFHFPTFFLSPKWIISYHSLLASSENQLKSAPVHLIKWQQSTHLAAFGHSTPS